VGTPPLSDPPRRPISVALCPLLPLRSRGVLFSSFLPVPAREELLGSDADEERTSRTTDSACRAGVGASRTNARRL